MITESDFEARGWKVTPGFVGQGVLPSDILDEMTHHPDAPGESSWGTRNLLHALVLSLKPKTVLEMGSHIGLGAVVIGTALKANGYGRSFHLEPSPHYFPILSGFIDKAGLSGISIPLQMLSTDPRLSQAVGSSVEIIFLDADHSYSHALADIKIADALLPENGLIIFDDVGDPQSAKMCTEGRGGVRQALKDFAADRPDYQVIFLEYPFWLNPCGIALACKQSVVRTLAPPQTGWLGRKIQAARRRILSARAPHQP